MSNVAAGWYPNPERPGFVRWWDGAAWTEHEHTDFSAVDASRLSKAEARQHVAALQQALHSVEGIVNRYGLRKFADFAAWRQEHIDALESHRRNAEAEVARLSAARDDLRREIGTLQQGVVTLTETREFQEVGLYDFEHPAETSVQLATELGTVRSQIKDTIRINNATTSVHGFTFNNSLTQGTRFVNALTKLMLRAYNAEAENAIKTTKAGNLQTAQARLTRAAEQIAKDGAMISLQINSHFHGLRLKEIELAHRHMKALQREKELEREQRAQLREQRKAELELKKEQERLEKERAHYQATLASLRANGDEEGVTRILAKIEDVERAIVDVDYRAANIRAGYVYVISNVGSFGPDVVKIGMTRRLEPMDRVRELGDASVPFTFDVHALFFADDAVSIENMLHKEFANCRINQVNMRREYFRTTPQHVLDALREHRVEVLEFTMEPAAAEFRESEAILRAGRGGTPLS